MAFGRLSVGFSELEQAIEQSVELSIGHLAIHFVNLIIVFKGNSSHHFRSLSFFGTLGVAFSDFSFPTLLLVYGRTLG